MKSPIFLRTAGENTSGANISIMLLASLVNNRVQFKQCHKTFCVTNTFELQVALSNPLFIRTTGDNCSGANIFTWFLASPGNNRPGFKLLK
jgi:hypothetical protein